MNMITLHNSSRAEVTVLSNYFIDHFMPEANGEFVKVYIYLVRMLSNAPISFSLEKMADSLLCTERDIIRALKYWVKLELISLDYDSEKTLCGITMLPISGTSEASASYIKYTEPARSENMMLRDASQKYAAKDPIGHHSDLPDSQGSVPEASVSKPQASSQSLTPDRIKELKQNEDIVQLLYIAEQYLGKTLTSTEMQKILFFYDGLQLSADLIEYLIEYCVSRNHKSIRYIETVALAWAEAGITTVQMAKEANSRYNKEYFTILKALGISNRNPIDSEIVLMDKWLKDFGFTMELISEACSRTVLQTGQPSFQYADKILSGWMKKKVHTLDDIRILDAEHKQRKLAKTVQSKPSQSSAPNRFNNFQQREYNFDEYEKRLLNQ